MIVTDVLALHVLYSRVGRQVKQFVLWSYSLALVYCSWESWLPYTKNFALHSTLPRNSLEVAHLAEPINISARSKVRRRA